MVDLPGFWNSPTSLLVAVGIAGDIATRPQPPEWEIRVALALVLGVPALLVLSSGLSRRVLHPYLAAVFAIAGLLAADMLPPALMVAGAALLIGEGYEDYLWRRLDHVTMWTRGRRTWRDVRGAAGPWMTYAFLLCLALLCKRAWSDMPRTLFLAAGTLLLLFASALLYFGWGVPRHSFSLPGLAGIQNRLVAWTLGGVNMDAAPPAPPPE